MEFNMKGGVLGIIVVCVILGVSILLVSVLDVQEETKEVTKYNYVTDTTSLFDFDKKPQYQDYDMVGNYTGYFTTDSYPYWGGVGEEGDGYYTTQTVNRYILNQAPIDSNDWATYDLRSANLEQSGKYVLITCYGGEGDWRDNGNLQHPLTDYMGLAKLKTLIDARGWGDATYITITSSTERNERVLIISEEDIKEENQVLKAQYTLPEYAEYHKTWGDNYPVLIAPLSAEINLSVGTVKLYSTPEPSVEGFIRTITLNNAYIVYNNGTTAGDYRYGNIVGMSSETYPPTAYLDIKQGVRVS